MCFGVRAQSLTRQELQTLPVAQLAPRLLGEVGSLMMAVDRSNFPYDLKLSGKASAPPTQYGLCMSDAVTVRFDSDGLRVRSISAGPTFAVVDSIYGDLSAQREEANQEMCARLTDTKQFFPASDWITAQRIVSYVDYLKGAGPFKDRPYAFECDESCDGIDGAAYVREFELEDITALSEIDCPEPARGDHCYLLDLTGSPPGLFPRQLRIYGHETRERAEVRKVTLWVGHTLF